MWNQLNNYSKNKIMKTKLTKQMCYLLALLCIQTVIFAQKPNGYGSSNQGKPTQSSTINNSNTSGGNTGSQGYNTPNSSSTGTKTGYGNGKNGSDPAHSIPPNPYPDRNEANPVPSNPYNQNDTQSQDSRPPSGAYDSRSNESRSGPTPAISLFNSTWQYVNQGRISTLTFTNNLATITGSSRTQTLENITYISNYYYSAMMSAEVRGGLVFGLRYIVIYNNGQTLDILYQEGGANPNVMTVTFNRI